MNDNCYMPVVADEVNKAIHSGCRMLSIREHSEKQIRLKLIKKGFSLDVVDRCIKYLVDENWLSETRFCNVFIRSKAARGQGLVRIESELLQQNIQQGIIDQQLELEDLDWQQICENTLLKKLRTSARDLTSGVEYMQSAKSVQNNKQRLKLENFLRYRGFSGEEIKIAIRKYLSIEHQEFK